MSDKTMARLLKGVRKRHEEVERGRWVGGPSNDEPYAGSVYSTCNLYGHPPEAHWHPPVGPTPFVKPRRRPPMSEPTLIENLLNSLGIAGPNIPHRLETEPDPKADPDLEAMIRLIDPDGEWCACGRRWPCGALELATLCRAEAASPDTGLDAAWAEAEAALPKGWRLYGVQYTGDEAWSLAIWRAWAGLVPGGDDDPYSASVGDTPAAALHALAARLAQPTGEPES